MKKKLFKWFWKNRLKWKSITDGKFHPMRVIQVKGWKTALVSEGKYVGKRWIELNRSTVTFMIKIGPWYF